MMAGLALAIQLLKKNSSGVSCLFQIIALFFHSHYCFALKNDILVDKALSIMKVANFRYFYHE